MDMESYDTLFLRTKESLQRTGSNFIAAQFSSALQECNTCISHGLELIKELLNRPNPQVDRLCINLENAITLLQMLSDLIKSIIESTTMKCCTIKPFPTITGNIIQTVFMHCKDRYRIQDYYPSAINILFQAIIALCCKHHHQYFGYHKNKFMWYPKYKPTKPTRRMSNATSHSASTDD